MVQFHPYRHPVEEVPPPNPMMKALTDDELAFWEKVYVAVSSDSRVIANTTASKWADQAVRDRRERFGVR